MARDPYYEYDNQGRQTGLSAEGRDFYAEGDRIAAANDARWHDNSGRLPLWEMAFPILQEVLNKKTFLLWLIIGAVLFPTGLAAHLGDKLGLVIGVIVFLLSPRFRAIALFVGGILAAIVGAFWLVLYFLGGGHSSRPVPLNSQTQVTAPLHTRPSPP